MRMTTLTAALCSLLTASGAAQGNLERVVNGAYSPSHDFDLIHQRIEVANFDWDATAFDGNVTTTLVSLRSGLDSVVLSMGRRLAVRRVTGAVKRSQAARSTAIPGPLRFARTGDTIVVRLPRAAGFRDTVRFTIDYRGQITHGRGLYFFKAEPGRPRFRGVEHGQAARCSKCYRLSQEQQGPPKRRYSGVTSLCPDGRHDRREAASCGGIS
jgi:hypothetical protein